MSTYTRHKQAWNRLMEHFVLESEREYQRVKYSRLLGKHSRVRKLPEDPFERWKVLARLRAEKQARLVAIQKRMKHFIDQMLLE
jgi:hypothetical protein